jgi:hypothetical protein
MPNSELLCPGKAPTKLQSVTLLLLTWLNETPECFKPVKVMFSSSRRAYTGRLSRELGRWHRP